MIKVYGPYTRKDGRKIVILYNSETGARRGQSYARYLMEKHLGRPLKDSDGVVDHINNDKTDDRIENLQLIPTGDNTRKAKALRG